MNNKSNQAKTYPAIALIEFNNIADGITGADAMVKKAPIAMLKSGTVSQGKYLVLIGGSTASVRESFQEGLSQAKESVIDSVFLNMGEWYISGSAECNCEIRSGCSQSSNGHVT